LRLGPLDVLSTDDETLLLSCKLFLLLFFLCVDGSQ
jgi:hypothetical protein